MATRVALQGAGALGRLLLARKDYHSARVSVSPRITHVAVIQANSVRDSSESSVSRLQGQVGWAFRV